MGIASSSVLAYVFGMSWDAASPPPIFDHEDELALKLEYARLIFGRDDRIRTAGHQIFEGPENYGRAMQCAVWRHDPVVIAELERLGQGDGAVETLPTKDEYDAWTWRMSQTTPDPKVALAFGELHGKSRGFVQVGNTNVAINDNRTVQVLRVPVRDQTPEDDADFERKFKTQQMKLVADARSNRPAT